MNTAIIVAAGRGTRMNTGGDKLWLELAGRPVIAHTWSRFEAAPEVAELVFVVRPDQQARFATLAEEAAFRKPFRFASGGPQRQDSVWNGLLAVSPDTEVVAIHDGARPCISPAHIAAVIRAARETGAAVAADRLTDTVKESADGRTISRHLERDRLWAVQTPQAFRLEVIRRALTAARERNESFTDDTAACQLIGQPVRLVPGSAPNPKVTRPDDLPAIAELLARQQDTAAGSATPQP